MKNFVLGLLAGAAVFCVLGSAYQSDKGHVAARQARIFIGDTNLTLGMSKADVMKVLSSTYILRQNETKGVDWVIEEKSHPGLFVAGLAFTDGKLSFATRQWLAQSTRDNTGGIEVARAVYGIVSNFVDRGEINCLVRVNHTETPDLSSKTAVVKCGPYALAVDMTAFPGREKELVDVFESLQHN